MRVAQIHQPDFLNTQNVISKSQSPSRPSCLPTVVVATQCASISNGQLSPPCSCGLGCCCCSITGMRARVWHRSGGARECWPQTRVAFTFSETARSPSSCLSPRRLLTQCSHRRPLLGRTLPTGRWPGLAWHLVTWPNSRPLMQPCHTVTCSTWLF